MPSRSALMASLFMLAGAALFSRHSAAQQYPEVPVTPTPVGDTEFDWGRDGISCPSCNAGQGNSRFNWTAHTNNCDPNTPPGQKKICVGIVYLAHIDPATGALPNQAANDETVDASGAYWDDYGNGPEWAMSTQGGLPTSQLVYSRFRPNTTPGPGNTGAALATQGQDGVWMPNFFPGAITTPQSGVQNIGQYNSNLPEASQCLGDSTALAIYTNLVPAPNTEVFEQSVSSTATQTPLKNLTNSNGIGERFVPCTHTFLYQGSIEYGTSGHFYQQVFSYDLDAETSTQLTFDNTTKYSGFMFQAPDYGNNYIFFTVANRLTIDVYEQLNGAFQLVNQITSPDPNEPYMNSLEPFINCTPTCRTYVFMTLAKTNDAQNGTTKPIGLAVAALDRTQPMFNILTAAQATPTIQRLDPEYFITAKGPYLYYTQTHTSTGSGFQNLGLFYIDMKLGTPSGPCVGSSAEGGLLQTPDCQSFLANQAMTSASRQKE